MRRELEIPLELPRVAIQRDQRIGVEIVTGACVTVPIRAGVAGAPEDRVLIGIIRASHPGGGGPSLRGIACPGFDPGLAGGRHGPESPSPFAGLRVVGVDETADAVLA